MRCSPSKFAGQKLCKSKGITPNKATDCDSSSRAHAREDAKECHGGSPGPRHVFYQKFQSESCSVRTTNDMFFSIMLQLSVNWGYSRYFYGVPQNCVFSCVMRLVHAVFYEFVRVGATYRSLQISYEELCQLQIRGLEDCKWKGGLAQMNNTWREVNSHEKFDKWRDEFLFIICERASCRASWSASLRLTSRSPFS